MLSRSSQRVVRVASASRGALWMGDGARGAPRRFIRAPPAKKPQLPDSNFLMSEHSYKDKSVAQLLRAAAVFTMCRSDFLVDNSEGVLRASYVRGGGGGGGCGGARAWKAADRCRSASWARR